VPDLLQISTVGSETFMKRKNYEDLKAEVWDTGRCSGCGACIAVCPADAIVFSTDDGSDSPVNTGYCKEVVDCVPCGACYAVCPRTDDVKIPKDVTGEYRRIVPARSSFEIAGKQSGGAVSAILLDGLERGTIDAVITVSEDGWTRKPYSVMITSKEAVLMKAGSRYNWHVPVLTALNEAVVGRKCSKIAIVGTPCVVQAARLMKESTNDLVKPFGNAIRLIIGLFCTESFDYERLMEGKLKTDMNIEPWQIRRMDVKGKLEITTDREVVDLPLAELDDCIKEGCRICTDFTGLMSDLSAGSVGSEPDYTTLVIRNDTGEGFVSNAVMSGKLEISGDINLGLIEKLSRAKLSRA
jgi:coenzyme F420 hydrogenase subunit beta